MIPKTSTPLQLVLEFRNVSIAFDDKPALIDITFKLYQGEMIRDYLYWTSTITQQIPTSQIPGTSRVSRSKSSCRGG